MRYSIAAKFIHGPANHIDFCQLLQNSGAEIKDIVYLNCIRNLQTYIDVTASRFGRSSSTGIL